MTKKFIRTLGISACMAAAFSISAFAEEITSISFAAGADAEAAISTGNTDPLFVVNDTNAEYELSSYSATSDSESFKTAKVYELTFDANSGYTFPAVSNITVQGKGITEITKKSLDGDTTLKVKVKAYPFHQWDTPTMESEDLGGKKLSWKKNGASTSEYIIKWTNQSGEQRIIHSTTGSSSVTISSYNKEYKGTKTDEYSDAHVDGFAVRVKGSAGSNPYTAPSDWLIIGDDPTGDADNIETYETWGDLFEGVNAMGGGSGSSSGGSSARANDNKGPGAKLEGWIGSGDKWYFYQNGNAVKGWYNDNGTWYYLNPFTGLMQTGWIIDNNKRYYLNPNQGGPLGAMVTGTQVINGQTYNFAASGEVM